MKSFIQNKLRTLLESKLPNPRELFNPFYLNDEGYSINPKKDPDGYLQLVISKVKEAQDTFGSIPYFNDPNDGAGVYTVKIKHSGKVEIGTGNVDGIRGNLANDSFEIHAHSKDVQHLQKGRENLSVEPQDTYLESPAADARVKAYINYGEYIIDKVKNYTDAIKNEEDISNNNYIDPDNTHVGNDKQTKRMAYIQKREKDRAVRQSNKGPTSLSTKDNQAVLGKQAALQAKYEKIKAKRGR